MPLVEGYSRQSIERNIKKEMESGKSHKQAVAIALNVARKSRAKARKRMQKSLMNHEVSLYVAVPVPGASADSDHDPVELPTRLYVTPTEGDLS
jgi:hypothetical protein